MTCANVREQTGQMVGVGSSRRLPSLRLTRGGVLPARRDSAQVALVSTLAELADAGGQVLCATHSPLLAAIPGANVLEVGPWGMRKAAFDELEIVGHWKAYLADPMRYLRHVL